MSSAIARRAIIEIAKPIGRHLRSGRTTPVWCGALLGGAIGATTGFVSWVIFGPCILVGALIGASIAAANFKWPPEPPRELGWMGRVVGSWSHVFLGGAALAVVTERAAYWQLNENGSLQTLGENLRRGADPESPECIVIPFDAFRYLELPLDSKTTIIAYEQRGKVRRQEIELATVEDRDAFATAVRESLGCPLEEGEEEVPFGRATLNPITLCCTIVVLAAALAYLAQHWRDFPPRNPVGKNEPDPLVAGLRYAGPIGVALIGLLLEIPAFAWLLMRIYWPPRIRVFRLTNSAVT